MMHDIHDAVFLTKAKKSLLDLLLAACTACHPDDNDYQCQESYVSRI